ncbi:MAG: TadE/TadG family type IV pilus assembly protein [Thermohalobaculum sp.]|nr:TadE/TadG family type IV pilus assembly protein [Thermohalobaculum sp.]
MRGELKPFVDAGSSMIARFLRNERGTATMEILLWLPLFLFLVFLTVDASILYWRHGEMWNVARDVARTLASGAIAADEASLDDFVKQRFGVAEFTVLPPVFSGDQVSVTVQRNPDLLTTFSVFSNLIAGDISATVTFRVQS